ncbi:Caffeoylshikimate esterase [Glycine max]|nr:Caffeoylshikimate esterase [Glycine max]
MEASATLRFVTHTLSLFPHTPISSISVSPKFSSNTTLSVAKKKSSIEGVSEELNAMTSQNLDFAPSRRRVRAAFTEVHQQLDHFLFKAALCFCHGYGSTCTFFFDGIAKRIDASGYGVYAMDYPGFGLSEGLHGYIPKFDDLVDDVIEHYTKIKARPEVRGLPRFILGQSMGRAIALKFHLKEPNTWDGVILVAPMCKAGYNVISYDHPTGLKTGMELLSATQEIESLLHKVSAPLLILHGADDLVTDPLVSQFLYEKASSKDKTLEIYEGSYHGILEGEPDDRIFAVHNDIISWLDFRCSL